MPCRPFGNPLGLVSRQIALRLVGVAGQLLGTWWAVAGQLGAVAGRLLGVCGRLVGTWCDLMGGCWALSGRQMLGGVGVCTPTKLGAPKSDNQIIKCDR